MTKAEQELVEHCLENLWVMRDSTCNIREIDEVPNTVAFLDKMEVLKRAIFAERAPIAAVQSIKEARAARLASQQKWLDLKHKMRQELGDKVFDAVLTMSIDENGEE